MRCVHISDNYIENRCNQIMPNKFFIFFDLQNRLFFKS